MTDDKWFWTTTRSGVPYDTRTHAMCDSCHGAYPKVPGSSMIPCAHVNEYGQACTDYGHEVLPGEECCTRFAINSGAQRNCEDVEEWQRRNLAELDL